MILFLSGLLRRLLGGWLSNINIIKERAVQWILCIVLYSIVIVLKSNILGGYNTYLFSIMPIWLFTIIGSISIVLCLTSGHFPGFMCGTESLDYINQQLAKGRKIKFKNFVDKIGKKRGFEPFSKEWCFWQLLCVKISACIIPSLLFGPQFIIIGALIAFIYNAMFWVKLKPFKNIITSPTGYGEFLTGWFIAYGLF